MIRPLLLSFFLCLSACSTLNQDTATENENNKNTSNRLAKEHNKPNIIIVNIRPAKSRQCWSHNRHWHCHR